MKQLTSFRFCLFLLLAGFSFVLAAGCAGPNEKLQQRLDQLPDARLTATLQKSIDATADIDSWARLQYIQGNALATVFEGDNLERLIEQQHRFVAGERIIVSLTSREPAGVMLEQLDEDGQVSITLNGASEPLKEVDPTELYGAALKLQLLAHAMTGPVGLLQEHLQLRYGGIERQGNKLTHKIEVTGDLFNIEGLIDNSSGELFVIWIDAESFLFDRLWLRYPLGEGKYGYLAVKINDYRSLPEGFLLPGRIEVTRSDQYQQFSQQNILLIEYQQLQVTLRKKNGSLFKWFR